MAEEPGKGKVNLQKLEAYKSAYSEAGFLATLTKYAGLIGSELVYKALQLYYVLQKPELPTRVKSVIIGALAYLILPADAVPDFIPVVGLTDDAAAIALALIYAHVYIDDNVRQKAKTASGKFFSKETVEKL